MSTAVSMLRHISIRVPWHDSGWNGSVCQQPARNTACLKLKNIFENKVEAQEIPNAGKSLKDLEENQWPPCVKERATFMADFAFTRTHEHPYVKNTKGPHAHFKPTPLRYPAFSAAALPFRWMMRETVFGNPKKKIRGLVERFPLDDVSLDYEPSKDLLGFDTGWLQDHRNHRALLDCFWNQVRPEESLVFFYAKQVPLVEDTGRRVIVGVGRIKSIGKLTEYEYKQKGELRSLLWERMVGHSIRNDSADGFLMPYHDALLKSDDGRAFDPADVVAFAPEDRFEEFSFATEHVSHDAAISALLACRAALLRSAELFGASVGKHEKWIDQELGRLWKKRGPFPGIGSVLTASGVPLGNFVAAALVDQVGEQGNPWEGWDKTLADPAKHLPKELSSHIDDTIAKAWKRLPKERRDFLELLSRIDLSLEQAAFLVNPESRAESSVDVADGDFLKNPYLIYEATRLTTTPVAVGTVDRGIFPASVIRGKYPLSAPTAVKTAVDARRLRALVVRELEGAALDGHTLQIRDEIVTALRVEDREHGEEGTAVTADLLAVAEADTFAGEVRVVPMANGRPAYQLERLASVGDRIRATVSKRVGAARHTLKVDWRNELDRHLEADRIRRKAQPLTDPEEIAIEERGRTEKAAALAEIAASRFSVLIGPAGTGKTTLLSVLCQRPEIHGDGILLLAPTGKARVRMESIAKQAGTTNYQAFTLAQFLAKSDRYDGSTGRYKLTGEPGQKGARTVIVDECSMLTEEMMAALLEALSGVDRLIFVGDPRQLPPIGAGRPFVDIVAELAPEDVEKQFPRFGTGYAELTIPRRQGAEDRDDLQLAAWFGGSAGAPADDDVFEILAGRRKSDNVCFIRWDSPDELEQMLPKVIAEQLEFKPGVEDWQSFAQSLGANLDAKGSAWFNVTWKDREGAGKSAERWQILSPVREKPWGVDPINRLVHLRYKGQVIDIARKAGKFPSISKPMGDAQIVYGDKVINNANASVWKKRIYPEPPTNGYLANGEIGMVVGHRRTMNKNWNPNYLEIEFSTQTGKVFKYYNSDFSEEGDASLELAYALTVHKAQGSEFEIVFLVLPNSPLMLTRELLYTALTRQKQKVVVLHQGSATDLQKLSSERYSSTACRLTNLFGPPNPIEIGDSFLEERLIHNTVRGEAVRSKSEVIIANLLHAEKVDYHYEAPLEIDGITKYPDFTIEDDDAGKTYFWEHCGMLKVPKYKRRWERKQRWYRENGILPYQEGGGPRGTLIVTEDAPDGGISSPDIEKIIQSVIGGRA